MTGAANLRVLNIDIYQRKILKTARRSKPGGSGRFTVAQRANPFEQNRPAGRFRTSNGPRRAITRRGIAAAGNRPDRQLKHPIRFGIATSIGLDVAGAALLQRAQKRGSPQRRPNPRGPRPAPCATPQEVWPSPQRPGVIDAELADRTNGLGDQQINVYWNNPMGLDRRVVSVAQPIPFGDNSMILSFLRA